MRTELRPYWLANRASEWCYIVGRASDTSRFGQPDILRQVDTHLYGAHMCVLALWHLHRCLGHLEELNVELSSSTGDFVARFKYEYEKAKVEDARHALEHEEDRVSGLKLHGRPAYQGDFPNPRVTGRKSHSSRLTMIQALDEDFELSEVIEAALALEEPLRELASVRFANSTGGM